MAVAGSAFADPVKIGMITTLSGGGAGLGVDMRDGFMLAVKQADNKDVDVIVEDDARSEEHTSELQSLMRISYAVFCLKKQKTQERTKGTNTDQLRRHTVVKK